MFKTKKDVKIDTEVNKGRLAQAVALVSTKIDLEKFVDADFMEKNIEKISINDDILINIKYYSYSKDLKFSLKFYTLKLGIYIGGIEVNFCTFHLNVYKNKNRFREWEVYCDKVYHDLPIEIVQIINDWSYQIVSDEYNKRQEILNEIEDSHTAKYLAEKETLNSIFKKYTEGK